MAMEDNPYAAPKSPTRAPVGVRSGRSEDVRSVAIYQKGIMVCILIYIAGVVAQIGFARAVQALPPIVPMALLAVLVVNLLVGVVFVFLLAMKVYHPVVGIFLAILSLVPLIGLLILLLVNSRATNLLKDNGYQVGLLGADLSRIPR